MTALRRRQRGQALLLATLSLAVLFGMLALVVDVGWAYFRQHAAQAAADAAAMAAVEAALESSPGPVRCGAYGVACGEPQACAHPVPEPPANNLAHACLYAAANGFPNTGSRTVTIAAGDTPLPPTVPGVQVRYWVTARVSERLPQLFAAVIGGALIHSGARATAAVFVSDENSCVYALDPSARGALTASGTAEVTLSGCDIFVNSEDSEAMRVTGNSEVQAGSVRVAGGYAQEGGAEITPPPVTGVPQVRDPFADLPPPSFGGCDYTDWSIDSHGTALLRPGVYCNGIQVTGGSSVTFSPGTYVLNGGGLSVSGNSTISGSGVMFYNTGRGYAAGPVTFSGGATAGLSAPDSGIYRGILFYQDRDLASPPESHFTGGSTMGLTGTIYFPTGSIRFAGGNETYVALVVRTVAFTGNSRLLPDPTGTHTGLTRRITALIE